MEYVDPRSDKQRSAEEVAEWVFSYAKDDYIKQWADQEEFATDQLMRLSAKALDALEHAFAEVHRQQVQVHPRKI